MTEQPKNLLNGRYQLQERIGAGGMASVYKATDTRLGRVVAIKMLHEGFMNDEAFVKQFQHEAHAAANLTHPNIVTVHDLGEDRGRFYMVLELIKGQTLKQIIRSAITADEPMPIRQAVDLTIQICRGVGYAHRAGLVHCDVKPQNILVTPDNRVKVADFGIARAMSQATGVSGEMIWGTPQYLSPEQAAGEKPTPASDVYAIGIMMYEMFTNSLPFAAESPTAIALMHLQEYPKDVRELNTLVPETLSQIVSKVLAKEPAGRYRTAGQLGRILQNYLDQSVQTTGPIGTARPVTADDDATVVSAAPPPRPIREQPVPRSEQTTQFYQEVPDVVRPVEEQKHDPTAVMLGVIALVAWLGLIPLWFFVGRAWGVF